MDYFQENFISQENPFLYSDLTELYTNICVMKWKRIAGIYFLSMSLSFA